MGFAPFVKCFCFAAFSFCVTGVIRLSVGETNLGLLVFAIFLAKRAFMPIPGMVLLAPFATCPRGACGTTMCAACEGLCIG